MEAQFSYLIEESYLLWRNSLQLWQPQPSATMMRRRLEGLSFFKASLHLLNLYSPIQTILRLYKTSILDQNLLPHHSQNKHRTTPQNQITHLDSDDQTSHSFRNYLYMCHFSLSHANLRSCATSLSNVILSADASITHMPLICAPHTEHRVIVLKKGLCLWDTPAICIHLTSTDLITRFLQLVDVVPRF